VVKIMLGKGHAGTSGRGEVLGKGGRRVDMVQKMCMHVYFNAKMIPVETTPGIGVGGDKGEW
jgi:hypothetical protein